MKKYVISEKKEKRSFNMDEFDKIREISEDLTNRKEPTFSNFAQEKEPLTQEAVLSQTIPEQEDNSNEVKTEEPVYNFSKGFDDKIDFVQVDPIEEKSFSSIKLHLIAIGSFVLVLSLILIGFFVFNDDQNDLDEIVTITASQDPVKETPDQAGGINIPDQDKLVYDRIRSDNLLTKVESLFPEPEKPVLPQIIAIEQNAPDENFVKMEDVKSINPLEDAQKESVESENLTPAVTPVQQTGSLSEKGENSLSLETKGSEKTADSSLKKEIIPLIPVVNKEEKLPVISSEKQGKGIWRAQLFSSNNKNSVEKAWTGILSKNKDLLSDMSYEIVKANIPGKGAFYRLKVGQFQTRAMAESFCTKLQSRKQDCIPAK